MYFPEFPIAILHELFFSVDRPQYINYASLGNTIGHEIIHGFDNGGRKYDLNGNLKNWWKPETKRNFLIKATCISNQYSHYTDPSTNLPVTLKSIFELNNMKMTTVFLLNLARRRISPTMVVPEPLTMHIKIWLNITVLKD